MRWTSVGLVIACGAYFTARCIQLQGRPSVERYQRALALDSSSAFAAWKVARGRQGEDGLPHPESLREVVMQAHRAFLPQALEQRLGLTVMADTESLQGAAEALAFLDAWRSTRRSPASESAESRAHRIRLVIAVHGLDVAWDELQEERNHADTVAFSALVAPYLLQALASDPTHEDAESRLAVVEELLVTASENPGEHGVDALLSLAELRFGQARLVDAVVAAEEAMARAPRDAGPYLTLSKIYFGTGQEDQGYARIREALRIAPLDPAVRFLEGKFMAVRPQRTLDGIKQMWAAYDEDAERVGGEAELLSGLAMGCAALLAQGRTTKAREVVEQALVRLPGRLELQRELARIERAEKNYDEARELYTTILERAPEDAPARTELAELLREDGYAHLLGGQREQAVERFRACIALQADGIELEGMQAVVDGFDAPPAEPPEQTTPEHRSELAQRARRAFEEGVQLYQNDDLQQALAKFRESTEALHGNPLAHLNIGRIELELNRPEAAEQPLRTALDLGAVLRIDVEHGYLLLMRSLSFQSKSDAAKSVAEQYRDRYPDGAYQEQIDALVDTP